MTTGTIKWFDAAMGFGFISPDDGGDDIFVHMSKVEDSKIVKLEAGYIVAFSVGIKGGKTFAYDISVTSSEPVEQHKHPNPGQRTKAKTLDALEQFEQDWGLRRV